MYCKFLRDSQLFKGIQNGVYYRFTCAWQTPLETLLQTLPICPDGHPHTWVLWVVASMKILLYLLLTAVSQLLSLGLAVFLMCPHLQMSTILCVSSIGGLSSERLVLLALKRCLHLLVSQLFKFWFICLLFLLAREGRHDQVVLQQSSSQGR